MNVNIPPTPPNPRRDVACTCVASSHEREHPPHPTQPKTWRSMRVCRKFTWTWTSPPHHPTQHPRGYLTCRKCVFTKTCKTLARFSPRWHKHPARRVGNGTCWHSHFTSLDVRTTLGFSIDFAFNYDSKSAVLLGFVFLMFFPQLQANFSKISVSPRMRFWDAMCLFPQRHAFFTCAFCFVKTRLLECHTAETSSHAEHVWTSHPTPPPSVA